MDTIDRLILNALAALVALTIQPTGTTPVPPTLAPVLTLYRAYGDGSQVIEWSCRNSSVGAGWIITQHAPTGGTLERNHVLDPACRMATFPYVKGATYSIMPIRVDSPVKE